VYYLVLPEQPALLLCWLQGPSAKCVTGTAGRHRVVPTAHVTPVTSKSDTVTLL